MAVEGDGMVIPELEAASTVKLQEENKAEEVTDPGGGGDGGGRGGSIAERRAGFNVARLNTARFRTGTSPLTSPAMVSPYLTIPVGLSPTVLLDSPMMLPNSMAQLASPTTGTFQGSSIMHDGTMSVLIDSDAKCAGLGEIDCSSFSINKSHIKVENADPLNLGNQVPCAPTEADEQQALAEFHFQCQLQPTADIVDSQTMFAMKDPIMNSLASLEASGDDIETTNCVTLQSSSHVAMREEASPPEVQSNMEDPSTKVPIDGDMQAPFPPTGVGKPSDDGYNWRKYGQKQVKGSEYPRSYYKCTNPNCQVKKKVERDRVGQITEIIYKGSHNHPKPQLSRGSASGSGYGLPDSQDRSDASGALTKINGGLWRNFQQQGGLDWRGDGHERTSCTSAITDSPGLTHIESEDALEISTTVPSDEEEEEEDGGTQGSISHGEDYDDEESESKRRRMENCIYEANLSSRSVREPRVVVQTTSEVDILDDGYRWRKYGQKVVKGNLNPRSYYKCTNAGCSVRKHVERASNDTKSVITTYEGKHNHEVPAARNSCSGSAGTMNVGYSTTASTQSSMSMPASCVVPKPEPPRMDDFTPHFEHNDYLRAAYLRRLNGDMKLGVPPNTYDMKLPPLQPMSYGAYGKANGDPLLHFPQAGMNFSGSLSMNMQPSAASFAGSSNLGYNHNNLMGAMSSFNGQNQYENSSMRLLRPKEEMKDEPFYDGSMLGMTNSIGSSDPPPPFMYNQMNMGRYQL